LPLDGLQALKRKLDAQTLLASGSRKTARTSAHSDDLEIGCGGTILQWLATYRRVDVCWVVLSAAGKRAAEAKRSASALLRGAGRVKVDIRAFADGLFPAQYKEIKQFLEDLKAMKRPTSS
jgi:LmbE family N-acetylglucosaminyl deacetylase